MSNSEWFTIPELFPIS